MHPQEKQCNYSYVHPTSKQCNYEPDLSNYATKDEVTGMSLIASGRVNTSSSGTTIASGLSNYRVMFLVCYGNLYAWGDVYLKPLNISGSAIEGNSYRRVTWSDTNAEGEAYAQAISYFEIPLPVISAMSYYSSAIYAIFNHSTYSTVHQLSTVYHHPSSNSSEWITPYSMQLDELVSQLRYIEDDDSTGQLYYDLYGTK